MTRIILEMALLAFCIAIVIFASQSLSVIDVVTKSFIVLVSVVGLIVIVLVTTLLVAGRMKKPAEQPVERPVQQKKTNGSAVGAR
ncbi:MAG TPA: hypothetical protein VMW43_04790 [Bacteroidota bacterium]|nr:hypothetical protein [Bacteroidota bacterium]